MDGFDLSQQFSRLVKSNSRDQPPDPLYRIWIHAQFGGSQAYQQGNVIRRTGHFSAYHARNLSFCTGIDHGFDSPYYRGVQGAEKVSNLLITVSVPGSTGLKRDSKVEIKQVAKRYVFVDGKPVGGPID